MLSDDAIENLVKPIIDRQENINNYVIRIIANRIKQIGTLKASDIYKLKRLYDIGNDIQLIEEELSRLAGLQISEIQDIIKIVAKAAYIDVQPFYEYRSISYIPFEKNVPLQRVVTAIAKQTADTYVNLSKAQAFMIRDLKNPDVLIPTPIAQTYQSVIDEAVQASQSGVLDYSTSMRRTLRQLNESGIRSVTYNPKSGKVYTQRLDTAVRRNLLDGIRAINQGVQDETGKQYGADGKEITVHENSAPDHEPIQGHQFTNKEYDKLQNEEPFQDVNGRKFNPIKRAIGTLNCRHFAYSIIIGYAKPNFTQKQLDENIKRNHKGYTLPNGKHLTMYECTQIQRELETKVRRAKDGQIMAREAGDKELAKQYQIKINKYVNEYQIFSKECGLSIKPSKMTVSGYRPVRV